MTQQKSKFGQFLHEVRKKRGLRLKDVAQACGKSTAYICDLEKGRRGYTRVDPEMLITIAKYLHIPMSALVSRLDYVDNENEKKHLDYIKLLRSKSRASMVVKDLEEIRSAIYDGKQRFPGADLFLEILQRIEIAVDSLDSCLVHRS